ncbi:DUF3185 family protein [Pseudohongiella sp. SYSU M77423]|uniref:DUF3185 family protein n=1 Tax=unclassified Pseudohongiella TaxID=2629611 RepID=UPI000C4C460F|nr:MULTISPECIES: DUF3185 family protein [unclassified Pseudohongiella]MAY54871.1 hypothetical protein [Gammaproteobacteria bacterium]MEC8860011.1 DUF3185 family protein [Pseudomonadota bacterium]HBN13926.1 hypothetical protein [Pseudohongiella sp.]MBJ53675.1 hypothetical protein [Gammaproteobacteria bacterium]MDH7944765.1 DUF3185 family protein [Pseudohongiella sp. SYSU M77423]|tara:strand:- start:357 stop:560 length:204 start_codon:yes stop_codon:yes gene_type:complete
MPSKQVIGIVLLVLGVLLLFFGWQSSQSVGEQVTEAVTGRFTDETMWYLIGGVIAVVLGAIYAFRKQ